MHEIRKVEKDEWFVLSTFIISRIDMMYKYENKLVIIVNDVWLCLSLDSKDNSKYD
jgi:hypothetical protein